MPSPPEVSTTSDSPPHIRCSAHRATARLTKVTTREDGRADDELRTVKITRGFTSHPAGSVLVEFGNTRVMCTASVEEGVPRWRKLRLGWLTAEYAMLPAATHTRSGRESVKARSAAARRRSVDSSADHFERASISRQSVRTPSPSTVMSSKPTVALAPRQ